jgi:hypothetical protein
MKTGDNIRKFSPVSFWKVLCGTRFANKFQLLQKNPKKSCSSELFFVAFFYKNRSAKGSILSLLEFFYRNHHEILCNLLGLFN